MFQHNKTKGDENTCHYHMHSNFDPRIAIHSAFQNHFILHPQYIVAYLRTHGISLNMHIIAYFQLVARGKLAKETLDHDIDLLASGQYTYLKPLVITYIQQFN